MLSPTILMLILILVLGIWGIIKLKREFNERTFFKIGMFLFLIQAVANTYGFITELKIMEFWAIIARGGSILFNYVIAYFFYWLMKKSPASMGGPGTTLSPEEIDDFMKGVKKDEQRRTKKKGH